MGKADAILPSKPNELTLVNFMRPLSTSRGFLTFGQASREESGGVQEKIGRKKKVERRKGGEEIGQTPRNLEWLHHSIRSDTGVPQM